MSTIAIEDHHGLSVCQKQPVAIERGLGSYVWDEQGRRYLDFTAGWGVTCLGHSHPVIVSAISEQAGRIMQNPNSGFTYSPVRARLLTLLQQVLPPGLARVFFANSGAEANDAAVKLARKVTGRPQVIAVQGSFHGRTLGTLSLSGSSANAEKFLPRVPGNIFVPFGDIESLALAMTEQVAAVILEPVQGEGGVRVPPAGYLRAVVELCQANGTLFIADEVQTGFCRTGHFFAVDAEGVTPDILTMGKGIAGGYPFAALALTESVANGVNKGDHGGTYCGNPLGCAVSIAVVNFLVQHDIADRVATMGHHALQVLKTLALEFPLQIAEVRGQGLLIGIQMQDDQLVAQLTEICLHKGLMITPTRGAVLRIIPGLLLSMTELEEGISILASALREQQRGMVAETKLCV
ncbi:MAG: aspartate aminotransferase family protein [Gammaproteobacteria bacterium]|nr:aspartate aminotransferase family protein [Gammaproteobacteria bacterium]